MTISKKHFINIAKILGENTKSNNKLIIELTLYLKSTNPKFNKDKFIDAIDKSRELKKADEVYYDHKFDLRAKQVIDEANIEDLQKEIKLLKAENQFHKDCADQYKKQARVLQSKVKTYEQDIEKYSHDNNISYNTYNKVNNN